MNYENQRVTLHDSVAGPGDVVSRQFVSLLLDFVVILGPGSSQGGGVRYLIEGRVLCTMQNDKGGVGDIRCCAGDEIFSQWKRIIG